MRASLGRVFDGIVAWLVAKFLDWLMKSRAGLGPETQSSVFWAVLLVTFLVLTLWRLRDKRHWVLDHPLLSCMSFILGAALVGFFIWLLISIGVRRDASAKTENAGKLPANTEHLKLSDTLRAVVRDSLKEQREADSIAQTTKHQIMAQLKERGRYEKAMEPRHEPSQVMRPEIEGMRWTQRQIPSVVDSLPYAIEVTVQVMAPVQPFGAIFVCDKEISETVIQTNGAYQESKGPTVDRRGYAIWWETPPVTPRSPMIVALLGKEPFSVLRVERLNAEPQLAPPH